MSHDGTDTLPGIHLARRKSYAVEFHHNSNRTRHERNEIQARRYSAGKGLRDFDKDPLITRQIFREEVGESLPRGHSREVRRAFRSKYEPHVGAKQKAKKAALA